MAQAQVPDARLGTYWQYDIAHTCTSSRALRHRCRSLMHDCPHYAYMYMRSRALRSRRRSLTHNCALLRRRSGLPRWLYEHRDGANRGGERSWLGAVWEIIGGSRVAGCACAAWWVRELCGQSNRAAAAGQAAGGRIVQNMVRGSVTEDGDGDKRKYLIVKASRAGAEERGMLDGGFCTDEMLMARHMQLD